MTDWINHIEAWQRSGLKQAASCREQRLNYPTFSARLSDYRKAYKNSLPALIPVQIPVLVLKYVIWLLLRILMFYS
jgi:hypothetical protein